MVTAPPPVILLLNDNDDIAGVEVDVTILRRSIGIESLALCNTRDEKTVDEHSVSVNTTIMQKSLLIAGAHAL